MIKRDMSLECENVGGQIKRTYTVPLAPDEIRILSMLIDKYQAAQVQAKVAQELQAECIQILRAKHELSEEYICDDVLVGFQRVEFQQVGGDE